MIFGVIVSCETENEPEKIQERIDFLSPESEEIAEEHLGMVFEAACAVLGYIGREEKHVLRT